MEQNPSLEANRVCS